MRSEKQAAEGVMMASYGLPPAQQKRGARSGLATNKVLPLAYLSGAETYPGDGHTPDEDQDKSAIAEHTEIGAIPPVSAGHSMPQGGEVQVRAANRSHDDLAATISALIALQRQRTFCIVSQSRCDRSVESFIAKLIGMGPMTPDGATPAEKLVASKARKAVFAQASVVRKAVEKGGEVRCRGDSPKHADLTAAYPIIVLSATSREGWDKHRTQVEKQMRKLARTLPSWPYVEGVSGFSDLGLAIVVGEAGDLANYATKERLWKRLGLAVILGERQQRRTNAEAAAAHGYAPHRRAEVWALADSMFRHQWRGAKEDRPAEPAGPYGAIYGARKAHTANREGWTPAHREADARRIMTKALVENLWRAWRGLPAIGPEQQAMPRDTTQDSA